MTDTTNASVRRREIVASAALLFREQGYHSVSMNQIAEQVGLQKPSVYHYFGSKTAISASAKLRNVIRHLAGLMGTHLSEVTVFFNHYRELAGPTMGELIFP